MQTNFMHYFTGLCNFYYLQIYMNSIIYMYNYLHYLHLYQLSSQLRLFNQYKYKPDGQTAVKVF